MKPSQTGSALPRWSRRQFMDRITRSAAAAALAGPSAGLAQVGGRADSPRKRVALIATEVRKYSHAQHFIDRLVEGYGWQGQHYRPEVDLVSLYVDQFPVRDLARDRERRHGVPIYPTIAEALTQGTSKLAVDGVIIIAEHGDYPYNAKRQKLYPRHKFFKEVVKVFEASGRAVPVFQDKHLSTDWKECVEQVDDARRLNFAFLAGSSLPVTWRMPSLDIPHNTELAESVCVAYGGLDSYDIHGYETAQCMSERRAGGESGVRQIHVVKGVHAWDMLAAREVTWSLVQAAMSRSHTLSAPPGYTVGVPDPDWLREKCQEPIVSFVDHVDGFRTTLVMANGLLSDFNYAGMEKGSGKVYSTQMHLPMPPRFTTLADFFNPLSYHIEKTIVTGKASYPAERTLLTSGMTLFGVESHFQGMKPLATPELEKVAYQVPATSTYWRA